MIEPRHLHRESWLHAATEMFRPWFEEQGVPLPEHVHISVGFPKGIPRAIGQCFDSSVEEDGSATPHVFICPSQGEPLRVLDILLHELIHAAIGCKEGHGKKFRQVALDFGLQGKMTETYVEAGTELYERLSGVLEALGPYPHSPLMPRKKEAAARKGWTRLVSVRDDSFKVVISPKILQENGPPLDPWGEPMVPVDSDDD